ncbi:hypothetical protein ETAA8_13170 [Anatilimnocola aggregata]|uniref:Uncharacterized protein n=1 Tax=Anatilimnocola aggregata TaxID=2528021 RepID=A0A517Y7N4_9BACT|nr:hypothetical protein [Anatilimnocola aggregata]QDU26241.1 hypothetical protein ETAA8_13170 [Anatilimnocola aggregata]
MIAELRHLHWGRELRQTFAQNRLAKIAEDIAAKHAPLAKFADRYRDEIHLTHEAGKYLMHNAMRRAFAQPALVAGFETLDAEVRKYLDGVLAQLETSPADKALLTQILSMEENVDRAALIAKVSDKTLQSRLVALLPDIERAAQARRATLALEAETRPSSVHHDFSKISLVIGARDVDAGGESQCVRDRRLRKHRGSRGLVYRRRGRPRPLDNTG